MLKLIQRAVDALKQVPPEHRGLVLLEAEGGGKKRGPKPGAKKKAKSGYTKSGVKRKKPGPKPGFKRSQPKSVVKKSHHATKPAAAKAPAKAKVVTPKSKVKATSAVAPQKVSSAKAEKAARLKELAEKEASAN